MKTVYRSQQKKHYKNLTSITETQSASDSWKMYRAEAKLAYLMNLEKPAKSTIEKIVNVEAIKYGKSSEPQAFENYVEKSNHLHKDFKTSTGG